MRGYTLLEIVVYVSILAVVAVLVVGSILSIYQAFAKTRVERRLALNGDVALETIIRDVRAAESFDAGISVFGTNPGVLQINIGGSTEKFSLSDVVLQIQKGGPAENLTSSDVSVTNLIFYATSTDNSKMIRVEFTLEAGSGKFQKTKNFYGSAVMRGAY
ncbi:hypothetical protein A3G55_01390 [Candidatus Giovannonibacteria bacterium RIFCSPLOWO2_12_FULL_44_25]|uniref:Prepilin-type N-terminal cleavage/methylation domain-containing protein n=3 Tax=Parcubacteria group TaxID=1794811 RepID=A0A837IGY8_9BACT|nr:MAG: hypothetical protein UW15_C0010G0007 [Parcubacteria group bacterium GW2011_GWC1_44_10]KKT60103.1 MAG: hypothetical protein UW53_C0003G0014 [Candidatus Giovannonibacteria bacterium GW2011_GWA1_44_25]KKU12700.1 MAG: hypothetical protein UX18_C0014G0018 [Candidatus Azambacteria bacterium GW2011_GWC2_45_7b]KKU29950.1 MAG: hypothetical protein UX43_C0003G0043 [Candidatus Giovannonibacteria bacterium GW2011_GWB1_46_20]OGF49308.1 MAG: hypothetical protein A2120_03225 [Candidatus Giovannonibact